MRPRWTARFPKLGGLLTIGSRRCGCQECGRVFTAPGHFDAHRVGGHCKDPAPMGLTLTSWGAWGSAMDEQTVARLRGESVPTTASATAERPPNPCRDCGADIPPTGRRGRPFSRCAACRA